ncbi:MAG: hypothetical protein JEZ11_17610 [Desulfobacterales bacterium]|nr:hypothetical protein [Desulfobacterales bacterium]
MIQDHIFLSVNKYQNGWEEFMRTLLVFLLMVSVAHAGQVGDMNNDGQVGLEEAIIVLQVVAGLKPEASLGQYTPASGTAASTDVLEGKTFSNDSGAATGTMPVISQDITPTVENQSISEGYHDGSGIVQGDTGLISENIRGNITVFGVEGTAFCGQVPAGGQCSSSFQCDPGHLCVRCSGPYCDQFDYSETRTCDIEWEVFEALDWMKNESGGVEMEMFYYGTYTEFTFAYDTVRIY